MVGEGTLVSSSSSIEELSISNPHYCSFLYPIDHPIRSVPLVPLSQVLYDDSMTTIDSIDRTSVMCTVHDAMIVVAQ